MDNRKSTSEDYVLQILIFTYKYSSPNSANLFNYRQKEIDSNAIGYDYFHVKLPSSIHPVYYYFHQNKKKVEQFMIQRRFHNESRFEPQDTITQYTLLGGMKIQWINVQGKNRLSTSFLCAKDIISRSNGDMKQEKSELLPYFVVKTSQKKEMELKVDQIVKLGGVYLKIEDIVLDPTENPNLKKEQILDLDALPLDQPNLVRKCRVCYNKSTSRDPELVNPCQCKGSMQYICIGCLQQWLKAKQIKSNKSANIHCTDIFECEVCKSKFPKLIIKNKRKYAFIQEIKENKMNPYLSIVMQTQGKNGQLSKQTRLFITVDKKGTVLGRLEDEDKFVFVDTTVSRNHAQINLKGTAEGPKMFIKEVDSLYGTLVYEEGFSTFLSSSMKEFQIGTSLFRLKIKKSL